MTEQDVERVAFEKWATNPKVGGIKLSIARCIPPFDTTEYSDIRTQIAWDAWRERAAMPDKPCPHVVTSTEGTSYCNLAESAGKAVKVLREALEYANDFIECSGIRGETVRDLKRTISKALATVDEMMGVKVSTKPHYHNADRQGRL